MKFYKAWNYLENHCIFKDKNGISRFQNCIDIEVVKVNPQTNSISEDESLNTKTRVWLESGPYLDSIKTNAHAYELDCGAKTFEKAIIKLARKVKKCFGDDEKEALSKVKALFDGPSEDLEYKDKLEEILKEEKSKEKTES